MLKSVSVDTDASLTQRLESVLEREIQSETNALIKCDASRHDRIAGRINGLGRALALVQQTAKSWNLDEEAA